MEDGVTIPHPSIKTTSDSLETDAPTTSSQLRDGRPPVREGTMQLLTMPGLGRARTTESRFLIPGLSSDAVAGTVQDGSIELPDLSAGADDDNDFSPSRNHRATASNKD